MTSILSSSLNLNDPTADFFSSYLDDYRSVLLREAHHLVSLPTLGYCDLVDLPCYRYFTFWKNYLSFLNAIDSQGYPFRLLQSYLDALHQYRHILIGSDEFMSRLGALRSSGEYEALSDESKEYVDLFALDLERGGALLGAEDKGLLLALDLRLDELSGQYLSNLRESTDRAFILLSTRELGSLPDTLRNKITLTCDTTSTGHYIVRLKGGLVNQVLKHSSFSLVRRKAYQCVHLVAKEGELDNSALAHDLVRLRHQRAQLLSYENASAFYLSKNILSDSEAVVSFLSDLRDEYWDRYCQEHEEYESFGLALLGEVPRLYDREYVLHRLYESKYSVNVDVLSRHFPLSHTLPGILGVLSDLFGLRFELNPHHPSFSIHGQSIYNYEVYEEGSGGRGYLGQLLFDLVSREGKRGGACCGAIKGLHQVGVKHATPTVFVLTNFDQPTKENELYLKPTDVVTLLHELGHALHHLLSDNQHDTFNGTVNVQRDAVEYPSQFLERLFYNAHYIKRMALPSLSKANVDALIKSKDFLVGTVTMRHVVASLLDIEMYSKEGVNLSQYEDELIEKYLLHAKTSEERELLREHQSLFHIFTAGYYAGLYGYKFAEQMAKKTYEKMALPDGQLDSQVLSRYKALYQKGGRGNMQDHFNYVING